MKRLFVITLYFINVILAFYTLLACEQKTTQSTQYTLKLALQPYEDFSNQEVMMANKVLDSFFELDITILPSKKLDPRAFVKIKMPRYRADSIIKFQKEYIKVDSFDYILGLTNKDISTTKKEKVKLNPTYLDWGILGLAYLNGNSCVISTKRMDKDEHPKKFGLRFRKVVIHEFGHNLNLPHCPDNKCVMTSAVESITNIDNASLAFCDPCFVKMKLKPKS
jgi:archaemetzincin